MNLKITEAIREDKQDFTDFFNKKSKVLNINLKCDSDFKSELDTFVILFNQKAEKKISKSQLIRQCVSYCFNQFKNK